MLAIGGFLCVFGLIVVSLPLVTSPILAFICVPGGVIPGAIVLGLGVIEYRRAKRLTEFATWVKTYRRISFDDLAKKLGKTPIQTERTLAQAIERGLLKGVVDRSTDEFVVQGTEAQQIFIRTCPHCGGDVERWAFPEERFTCRYCNTAVDASVMAAPAR